DMAELTLEMAERAVKAAQAKARELGTPMTATVVDDAGRLVLSARGDQRIVAGFLGQCSYGSGWRSTSEHWRRPGSLRRQGDWSRRLWWRHRRARSPVRRSGSGCDQWQVTSVNSDAPGLL